ncbi:AIPR family protein [Biformimicrobium ophioploci]|uniref:AIPR family protein n=1 Tax=Biformimicrobium ophioploci TaxID=3036711 RepID=A0ABQ6LVZ4_9GAMM|nr:AIPR family protein [Microbulbifer sp. NKW57]GMG86267.1 AIPR family protein [Microbulbifer sp. NKW57]
MDEKAIIDDYYSDLLEHIKASSDVEGQLIEHEYLEYILALLSDSGEFDDYSIVEDGRDGAERWLVDGYSYDENNYTLTLFATLFSTDPAPDKLTRREVELAVRKLFSFLEITLSNDISSVLEPTSTCYQAAEFIQKYWGNVSKVNLMVISNRQSIDFRKGIESKDFGSRPCSVHIWDLNRIYKLEASRTEREEMDIDLKASPIPCLPANLSGEEFQSLLAVIPAATLVELYGKWGSRLLEQNVRSFLQNRGKVNKGIRSTIIENPGNFFPYNNGITATAEAVEIDVIDGQNCITGFKNLQIVNGGQTTASIYSAYFKDKADISNVFVQMKLTVLSSIEDSDLISKIARYANSQNKVSDADLFSNHPYHVRIEGFSRRIWVPIKADQNSQTHWFYERARGQYLDAQAYMSKAERRKFQKLHPRNQLLTKTDVAKIMNSWDMLPHEVSKGAQKNFAKFAGSVDKDWMKDDLYFNEHYFRKLVTRAFIFRKLEKDVLKASWYLGYRANIVTYAIARLALAIQDRGKDIDYDVLWRAPQVPEAFVEILMTLAESINEKLHDENRPIGNISEYAKRQTFWEAIKNIACDIETLKYCLVDRSDARRLEANSKSIQKEDNSIRAQELALNTSKEIWAKIESYLLEEDAATPSLMGILKTAKNPAKFPSEKQSQVLVKLLARFEDRLA